MNSLFRPTNAVDIDPTDSVADFEVFGLKLVNGKKVLRRLLPSVFADLVVFIAEARNATETDRKQTSKDRLAIADDRQAVADSVSIAADAALKWDNLPWQAGKTYKRNTALVAGGSTYRAIVDHEAAVGTKPGVGGDWQTAWRVLALEGAPGIVGREYPVSIYKSDGSDIAVQGYTAARFIRSAGTLSHFFAEVTHGTGSVELTVLRNSQVVHGPVTVAAGALVDVSGLTITVQAGDNLAYMIGAVGAVSGLWVQLDGVET